MKTIHFRDWQLTVDYDATKRTYDQVALGSSDSCTCDECRNFDANRNSVFPEEVKQLLSELGIGYTKDCEAYHIGPVENGQYISSGWFHFKGTFIGKDCLETSSYDLTPITETFRLGFTYGNDLNYFGEQEGLVQVEFEARVPWVL